MTAYLPPGAVCTAYWYAARAQMVAVPLEPGDLEFLCELGLRAALLARWEGIAPCPVPEGPYRVHQWPEHIWSAAADAMARHAAEHGDYGPPENVIPPSGPFPRDPSCDRCNYDTHRCKGCGEPLPHGTEACAGCDGARGGWAAYGQQAAPRDDFWSYPAPPEDTQAYADWCAMADEEGRVPAGFAYRELTDAEEAAENATWD